VEDNSNSQPKANYSTPKQREGQSQTPAQRAFWRRKIHANITAQTGRILQALGYPSGSLRDLIDAIQSAHGAGADAETPYTPFARSHLTIAEFMELGGKEESRISMVSRALSAHKKWQRERGIIPIEVISPAEDNDVAETTYIDYLTPIADQSFQHALSSELWRQGRKGKNEAIAESLKWAIEQLPRRTPETDSDPRDAPQMALADYAYMQKLRIKQSADKVGDRIIDDYRSDEEAENFFRSLARDLMQTADSIRKTRRARYAVIGDDTQAIENETAIGTTVDNISTHAEIDPPAPSMEALDMAKGLTEQSTPIELNSSESSDLDFWQIDNGQAEPSIPDPDPDMMNSALGYTKLGFAIFPLHSIAGGACDCGEENCSSPGKHPRIRSGVKDATKDPEQIARWWRKWPRANIGIATGQISGIVVMDVDFKNGGDAGLGALVERIGDLPDTYMVRTGNGWHFYFAGDVGDIRNSVHKLGEGLDVRGAGGYVVAPPSLHYSGRRYEMASDFLPTTIPPTLRALMVAEPQKPAPDPLRPRRQAVPGTGHFPNIPGGLRDGDGRNEILFRKVACRARFFGASFDEILEKLEEANAQYCADPLSYKELRKIAGSAARYASGVRL
jgi:hypothetical protein